MRKIGFALIGSGAVSQFHIKAILECELTDLVGIFSVDSESAKKIAAQYGVRHFKTLDELLTCDDVEVVNICTPSGTHTELALKMLDSGKHVMVEKPLALTPQDCQSVIDAAKRSGRLCAVFAQLRFFEQVHAVKKAIDDGLLGKITIGSVYMKYYRSAEYYSLSDWRGTWEMDGGGALMNQGIHGIDLLRYLLGEVKSVSASCKTLCHDIEVEDTAVAILEYENEAIGVIEGTTSVYPGYSRILDINGTKGSIRLDENDIVRWDVDGAQYNVTEQTNKINGASDPTNISHMGHKLQIENMAKTILGEAELANDAESGKRTVELICAIYESSKQGTKINLKDQGELK